MAAASRITGVYGGVGWMERWAACGRPSSSVNRSCRSAASWTARFPAPLTPPSGVALPTADDSIDALPVVVKDFEK